MTSDGLPIVISSCSRHTSRAFTLASLFVPTSKKESRRKRENQKLKAPEVGFSGESEKRKQ